MFARYRELLDAVRRSYTPEKKLEEMRLDFLAYLIYRPISFWITPLFLLAGFSADGATCLGFVIAVTMPVLSFWGGSGTFGCIACLCFLNLVLDCVDGNIARTTGRSSPVGAMLDGACTMIFWPGYFIAVGGLAQDPAGGFVARHGRELGLVLAVLFLAQRGLEDALDACRHERVRWEPPLPAALAGGFTLAQLGRPVEQIVAFGGLAICGLTGTLSWFAAGLATYQVSLLSLWLPRYVIAVRRHSMS